MRRGRNQRIQEGTDFICMYNLHSRVLEGIQYCKRTETLLVTFKTGRVYWYEDVPQEIVRNFIEARSKGAFYNKWIKHNKDIRPAEKVIQVAT